MVERRAASQELSCYVNGKPGHDWRRAVHKEASGLQKERSKWVVAFARGRENANSAQAWKWGRKPAPPPGSEAPSPFDFQASVRTWWPKVILRRWRERKFVAHTLWILKLRAEIRIRRKGKERIKSRQVCHSFLLTKTCSKNAFILLTPVHVQFAFFLFLSLSLTRSLVFSFPPSLNKDLLILSVLGTGDTAVNKT